MALWRLRTGDVSGFKVLFSLAAMYALMAALVYCVVHMKFITPLPADAPLERFSEARAIEHVRVLAEEIGGRQEGRSGLREAATYIKSQLQTMKERAGPNLRVEVEEDEVDGSFSMMFLGHSISLGYRNHTNIIMRISSVHAQDTDPSVLLNAHYDSPIGSPGAADCGSCVASLLESARLIIDSGWVPPRPVVFLFNGAEELFLVGSHGFMMKHKLRDSIGAFIDVEASGTGGPDLVCQSGPGSWPSLVYSQAAVHPMAHSAAQDVFPVIPGDTDYRMFAEDYGDIPGLDIIFLLGGYYYHTAFDTVDRLVPGSMQARGDNLVSVLKAFSNSPKLKTASERRSIDDAANAYLDERAVFFDYLTMFMVYYPRRMAWILHSIPFALFLIAPFFSYASTARLATFRAFLKGVMHHAAAIFLGIIFPILLSIIRLFFSNPMSWFAHSYIAFFMFVPSSLFGLLIPRTIFSCCSRSKTASSSTTTNTDLSEEARFWGAFGFYAVITLAYIVAGLSGGFLTFISCVFMLLAWISFRFYVKSHGSDSIWSTMVYVMPLVPCLLYSVYFGGFLTQFLIEKTGMMGSIPPPYGYYVADVIVAAVIGLVCGWCVGPLLPICDKWLGKSTILKLLVNVTVVAMAVSSQLFPYSKDAPKRVLLQHTFNTYGGNEIVGSSYDLATIDANSIDLVFKHAPKLAMALNVTSSVSLLTANPSPEPSWLALFPVSALISRDVRLGARADKVTERYSQFPQLSAHKPETMSENGSRRVHLQLSHGSLEEIWVTVLNITGPLSGWSFSDGKPPVPEAVKGGPPSYILRLSGNSHENWSFWLEASGEEELRVEVAVMDQVLDEETAMVKGLFPDWADVISYSSFLSSYVF